MGSKIRSARKTVSEGLDAAVTEASRVSRQTVTVTKYLARQARAMTRDDAKAAAVSFTGGVVLGSFSKDETIAAHAGRVVGGIIPIYGTAASVRDCVAAAHRLSKGDKAAGLDLTLGVLSLIPGARLATNAVRGAQTAMQGAAQVKELADEVEKRAKTAPAALEAPKQGGSQG